MHRVMFYLLFLSLGIGLAAAQEVPKRKSGLWEITRTSTRNDDAISTVKLCVDQATDKLLLQVAENVQGEKCTTNKLSRDGAKLVVDATCKLRGSTSTTHAVITGQFDSAYKIESSSTYKPPFYGQPQGHAVIEAKWTGPCAPGQRPGDMTLSGGRVVNIYDTPKNQATPPPGWPFGPSNATRR